LPGANFNFRELFDIANAFFYHTRSAAEANATRQRQLAQEEEDWELVQLIGCMHNLSIRDPAYTILYGQCARRFPNIAKAVPKPEPSSEHVQSTTLRSTSRDSQALPVPSSPARVLPPFIHEMSMLPTNSVVPMLTVPVEPPPVLASALDLISCAPVLPDVAPLTTPSSLLLVPSRPRGPRCMLATTASLASATPVPYHLSPVLSSPSPTPPACSVSPPLILSHPISVSLPPILCRPVSVSPL
jgi:hypothetical protein